MEKMIKRVEGIQWDTVIFDLDGTLLDTLQDLTDSVNHALSKYGLPVRTLGEIRQFVGNGVTRLLELAVPQGRDNSLFDEIMAEFSRHYAHNCRNLTCPYSGIIPLLDVLKEKGFLMAIVSNKPDGAVKELKEQFFSEYIEAAVGERPGTEKKPAPDSVLQAMDQLGSKKRNTVYIGDSEVDIQTAKNAGIDLITVSWGFRNPEYLREQGAKVIVDSPQQILDILGVF